MGVMGVVTLAIGAAIFAVMTYASIVSARENEPRAAARAVLLCIVLPLPYVIVGLFSFPHRDTAGLLLTALTVLALLVLITPTGRRPATEDDRPKGRIDERDTMFSRNALQAGSAQFHDYYRRNPDKKELDDEFRAKPGLLKKGAKHYEAVSFTAADATFRTVETLYPILAKGPPVGDAIGVSTGRASAFLKRWAKKLGAVSVGITELRDYHLYTVMGRWERYGQPVDLKHKFAIALTVEMDKRMIDSAPFGPTVMESAQQYLSSGTIAVQIAEFIHGLGYPARAHIDANYQVICPLVARDACLGEIGRMGLLMTPELGPRVRIAVVTTDLPLLTEEKTRDYTMIDFCRRCRKCAEICPSKAIPLGDRAQIDGVRRWKIDSEACFTYWCSVGTDCALCIRACPYSHPDGFLHNVVRRGVRNSSLFREFALKMDDLFYGRKPSVRKPPDWMTLGER